MKRLVCFLVLATFAAVVPSYGQETAESAAQIGSIHRPTPKPTASPGAGASTAKAAGPVSAGLYKDAKAQSAATTFAPTDTIYVIGKDVTAKKGDKVGVNWYGKGDKKLTTSESTVPSDGVFGPTFHLSPPDKGTPAGSYRADFVQNGKVVKRLSFTVK